MTQYSQPAEDNPVRLLQVPLGHPIHRLERDDYARHPLGPGDDAFGQLLSASGQGIVGHEHAHRFGFHGWGWFGRLLTERRAEHEHYTQETPGKSTKRELIRVRVGEFWLEPHYTPSWESVGGEARSCGGDGSTIVYNSFDGTSPGYRPTGLGFSGENVLVGTNRFSDMDTGIVLIGSDLNLGTLFGIASNAMLTTNGFCNVINNYDFLPLATYTVQGTLTCPPPKLDIRAVQLSWPYSYCGYSVETAPALDGPWTPSDAAVFLQGGQKSAVIPANSDQHYFRLVKY